MHMPDTKMTTTRDIEKIIKPLGLFGSLTTEQLARHSKLNLKICQRRCRILIKEGYLERTALLTHVGQAPFLYYLGTKGVELSGIKFSKPRLDSRFSHSMKNSDILIDIMLAFDNTEIGCEILPEYQIRTLQYSFIPDAAFCLERNSKSALFLVENCSGTETIRSVRSTNVESKLASYSTLFENNDIGPYNDYFQNKFQRFRLLYITNSHQRLNSINQLAGEYDKHGFIYMTTIKELESKGIRENIWRIPAKKLTEQRIVQ